MNNHIKRICLYLFYIAALFFIGCIPEDSLEWSDDGSVGLLRVEGALYLVDGQTGKLTGIAKEDILPWPDISNDGNLIAYSINNDSDNLSEALEELPDEQVKMIKYYARQMADNILSNGGLIDNRFPEPSEELMKADDIKDWVIRYVCENADEELVDILGQDGIQLGKGKSLRYYQVIIVSRNDLEDKRVIATSMFPIMATRLSNDNQHVAYIMNVKYEGEDMEYSLYAASIDNNKSMLVDKCVSIGYDWNEDSREIAYLSADSSDLNEEMILGTLNEIGVVDSNGTLLYKEHDVPEQGSVQNYDCSKNSEELAGMFFYPWMKVRYGIGGRIFFSTIKMSLPTGNMEDSCYSIFCYDPVINSITDIMPLEASAYASKSLCMLQFELSKDSKNMLVPFKENRFLGFELDSNEVEVPFSENEAFGEEDISQIIPVFKGDNEITFLVSEDNHYLTEAGRDPNENNRYEIIVLNTDNGEVRILSESWPDEIMENLTK